MEQLPSAPVARDGDRFPATEIRLWRLENPLYMRLPDLARLGLPLYLQAHGNDYNPPAR